MASKLDIFGRLPWLVIVAMSLCWCMDAGDPARDFSDQLLRMCIMTATFACCALLHVWLRKAFLSRAGILVIFAIGVAADVTFLSLSMVTAEIFRAVEVSCCVLTAVFQAIGMMRCLMSISELDNSRCILSLLCWQVIASVLIFIVALLGFPLMRFLAPVVFLIVFIAELRPGKNHTAEGLKVGARVNINEVPFRLVIIVALIVMVWYVLGDMAGGQDLPPARLGEFLVIIFVVVAICTNGKGVRNRVLYNSSLLLLGGAVLAAGFSVLPAAMSASSVLSDAAYAVFQVFYYSVICSVCLRHRADILFVAGVALTGEAMGAIAGALVPRGVAAAGLGDPSILLILMVVLAAAFMCLATDKDYNTSWGTASEESYRMDLVNYYSTLPGRCSAITSQYGISRREEDVLLLLAQAKTQPDIAEELSVSLSTVKTHVRSIYRKTGVHSRGELLELVGYPGSAEGGLDD